jgi:hypothetical protein
MRELISKEAAIFIEEASKDPDFLKKMERVKNGETVSFNINGEEIKICPINKVKNT